MKIGILTFHSANNYGAVLQCYAMQQFLLSKGQDAKVIDYRPTYFGFQPINFKALRCSNPLRYIFRCCLAIVRRPKQIMRNRGFQAFREKYLTLAPDEILQDKNSGYDAFVYGSDQIWDWEICNGYDAFYFANFPAAKKAKNIAYAASLGKLNLPSDKVETLNRLLSNYSAISVREKDIIKLIDKSKYNVKVVIDPTLLFPKAFTSLELENRPSDEYVLVYEVARCPSIQSVAESISNKLGYGVKRISMSGVASPSDFLAAFKYAKCVVTTSFHGVAFSIIYSIPFYTIRVGTFADIRSASLLKSLDIENRMILADAIPPYSEIDYKTVYNNLLRLQEESSDFLLSSILGN